MCSEFWSEKNTFLCLEQIRNSDKPSFYETIFPKKRNERTRKCKYTNRITPGIIDKIHTGVVKAKLAMETKPVNSNKLLAQV